MNPNQLRNENHNPPRRRSENINSRDNNKLNQFQNSLADQISSIEGQLAELGLPDLDSYNIKIYHLIKQMNYYKTLIKE